MSDFEKGKFAYYEASLMAHGSLLNVMGTRFDIIIIGKNKSESEAVWFKIESELKRLDRLLNRFDPASEVSKINNIVEHQQIRVSEEMWQILNNCKFYHQETFGLFDITLKNFYAIRFHEHNKAVSFSQSGIRIDFGGYGKGYALKRIKGIMEDAAVHQCFVDFGNSSILGVGHHPFGDAWKVSIENPFDAGQTADEISLRDMALSVSGNTPSYSGHIVHPKSGSPETGRKSVSVIMNDPLDAEVLSTTFSIATESEKEQLKKSFKIFDAKEYNF
ncbi:MAG: FAD:protein FMN transferase [Proteiniphilum sp.]|jgi:thiamine biosynthesis lipoprotein|nr:FAD:protein FMN transferase [Proteiniphilum sp.]